MTGRVARCLANARSDRQSRWVKDAFWYEVAFDYARGVALKLSTETETVVGFMSALSPRNSWTAQLKHTPVQLEAALQGLPVPHEGTGDMKKKASRIAAGDLPLDGLGGPKVRAVVVAIMSAGKSPALQSVYLSEDEDGVIDVHAWAVATGREDGEVPITGYRAASRAYHIVASAADMNVHHVQAICWAHWRRTKTLED